MKYGGPEKPWAWDGRGSFLLSYLLAAAALGAHRETVLQSWTNLYLQTHGLATSQPLHCPSSHSPVMRLKGHMDNPRSPGLYYPGDPQLCSPLQLHPATARCTVYSHYLKPHPSVWPLA